MSAPSIRVLIVEDDDLVGEVTQQVARAMGYSIAGMAVTGTEAVELTQALQPDVVLMDIQMPDMDGLTAARQIDTLCPTPVVVLTAYDSPDLIREASAAGVGAYLVKPPQAREMDRAVTVAMARFRDMQELRRLKAEAEAAVAARDALFGVIVHDLRNPLTAIRGYAQFADMLLQGTISPSTIGDIRELLANLDVAARRMTGQINEFLDIAQIRSGKHLDLQLTPTDLVALSRQLAADAQQTSDSHRVVVAANVTVLSGLLDPVRVGRMVSNLLSNAIRYSPSGGTVELSLNHEADEHSLWALLAVRDEGVGIPAQELSQIFEPFSRASNVTGKIRGIGLGLASVRQIVAQHGGTIAVSSKVGHGTTFTVRLPLVQGMVA